MKLDVQMKSMSVERSASTNEACDNMQFIQVIIWLLMQIKI